MIEEQKQKYRLLLARATAHLSPDARHPREDVYRQLRSANEGMIGNGERKIAAHIAEDLRRALDEVIAEDRRRLLPAGEAGALLGPEMAESDAGNDETPEPRHRTGRFAIGLVLGGAIGLAALAAVAMFGFPGFQGNDAAAARAVKFEQAYQALYPQVEVASAFLERVREYVVERQTSDPTGLTAVAGQKFVPLSDL